MAAAAPVLDRRQPVVGFGSDFPWLGWFEGKEQGKQHGKPP